MGNQVINTLNYTGIVTLSQYNGTKKVQLAKIHNTGGASLFSFLASCLMGEFNTAKMNRPAKIKLLYQDTDSTSADTEVYTYSSASGFIFLRKVPEIIGSNTSECRVRYSFMIPRDLFENISNAGTLGLGLYTKSALESEPENFAALCMLDETLASQLRNVTHSSLLVDWELIISNKNSNQDLNNLHSLEV